MILYIPNPFKLYFVIHSVFYYLRKAKGRGTEGFTFCKFSLKIPTDSMSNLRNFDGLGSKSVGYTPLCFLPEVSDACRGLKSFCDITGLCCTVLFPGIPHFLGLEVQLRLSTCSTAFFLDISSSFQVTAIT